KTLCRQHGGDLYSRRISRNGARGFRHPLSWLEQHGGRHVEPLQVDRSNSSPAEKTRCLWCPKVRTMRRIRSAGSWRKRTVSNGSWMKPSRHCAGSNVFSEQIFLLVTSFYPGIAAAIV